MSKIIKIYYPTTDESERIALENSMKGWCYVNLIHGDIDWLCWYGPISNDFISPLFYNEDSALMFKLRFSEYIK